MVVIALVLSLGSRVSRAQQGNSSSPPVVATAPARPADEALRVDSPSPPAVTPAPVPTTDGASRVESPGPRAVTAAPMPPVDKASRFDAPTQPAATSAPVPPADGASPFSFGADLGVSWENEEGSTSVILAPLLEGALVVHPRALLDLTWGAAWMVDNQGLGQSTGRVGNPMLSGIIHREQGRWRGRCGLGVTAPLAHFPLSLDGRLDAFVYNQTLAMWGMWNQWLWLPDRMAIPVSGQLGYALSRGRNLSVEAALAPVIGVRGKASGVALVQQMAVEISLPISHRVALCPRLQAVLLPSTSLDRLQSALGLRVTYQTASGRFFFGGLLNLDAPLGIFGGLERWGLHVGKEVDL